MLQKVINILLAIAIVEGRSPLFLLENRELPAGKR